MERLEGEVRDRVRAAAMWLVAGLTVLGIIIALWAIHIGFLRTSVAPADVASISSDGRTITLEVIHGSCQQLAGVEAEEDEDVVVLTAYVTERTPLRGRECTADAVVATETVTLEAPVGGRVLRTAPP